MVDAYPSIDRVSPRTILALDLITVAAILRTAMAAKQLIGEPVLRRILRLAFLAEPAKATPILEFPLHPVENLPGNNRLVIIPNEILRSLRIRHPSRQTRGRDAGPDAPL